MTYYNTQAYQKGLTAERKVINALGATASSKSDNIERDIDYYYKGQSVSLKTQSMALRTGNLAFELETQSSCGSWAFSWFYKGEAEVYHFLVGSELFALDKQSFDEYIWINGWDRTTQLSLKTQQSQKEIGHRHVNSKVGLISLSKLKQLNLLTKLREV